MADKVTVTIDDRELTVPAGTLVIRAAEQLGIIIPRFCDHPLLDPVGACRQCVVEVEGAGKPMMSCTTPVQDGMVVRTHRLSEIAADAQEAALEFLLINHPLDCPMCDKGGECPLQDQALAHGPGVSRFIDQKRRYNKPVAVSPQILLDRERCVLCARCTRFSEQISGHPFIELFERGALEQVAIYEDEPYSSYFSGNIIQICPVGALTSTEYRFKARPFDVRSAPTVCDHCSAGCLMRIQSRRGEIQRQLARTNLDVNEMWTCDRGRFGFHHLTASGRLTAPRVRGDGGLVEATWSQALRRATDALDRARERDPGRVAVLTGSRLADEDAYAVSKYARAVLGTDHVEHRTDFSGAARTDETIALAGRPTATYADVEQAPTILVVGLDPEEEVPILFLRIRKAWRDHGARIVPVGPRLGTLSRYAWRWLATAPGREAAALAELVDRVRAPAAADAPDASAADALTTVARQLREDPGSVLLVGERAPTGVLRLAHELADAADGSLSFVPRRAGAAGAAEAGLAAGRLPGGRRLEDPADHEAVAAAWGSLPAERGRDLEGILRGAVEGDIEVLHLIGVDPARDAEDPELARRALQAATVVLQDLAATDTLAYADVVLPAVATQERGGTITDWEGRSQRFRPGVDAPELAQEDWKIVLQLSALLGADLGFNDLDALRAERDRLGRREEPHDWPAAADVEADWRPEVVPGPAPVEAGAREVVLELVTHPFLLDDGTMLAGADNLRRTARSPFAALSPAQAGELGVAAGDQVVLRGRGGRIRLPVRREDGLVPGVVFAPSGSTRPTVREVAGGAGSVTVAPVEGAGEDGS